MKLRVEKQADLSGHKDSIYALCEGEENTFFSAGGDGYIVRWDISDPSLPGTIVARLPSAIYSLKLLKGKNLLIAGTRNGILYVFDLNTKNVLKELQLIGEVFAIAIETEILIAGTGGGKLYSIDIYKWEILSEMQVSDKSCRALSMQNGIIASGWSDNFIRLISMANYSVTHSFEAHSSSVFSVCFNPGGNYILSGSRDAHLKIWEVKDASLFMDIPAHWFAINAIQYSLSGKLFATCSRDKTIKIWDAESLELIKVIDQEKLAGHTHSVNALLWLSNSVLLSAGDDRRICIWTVAEQFT